MIVVTTALSFDYINSARAAQTRSSVIYSDFLSEKINDCPKDIAFPNSWALSPPGSYTYAESLYSFWRYKVYVDIRRLPPDLWLHMKVECSKTGILSVLLAYDYKNSAWAAQARPWVI